ncbi:MAG: hypothetical protein V3575_02555 [Candidatus Absconditabacteria bacterium]
MNNNYDYELEKEFALQIESIYDKYKYSNNYHFYEELGDVVHNFPIHVLTDFDNTFAISTEYKLFRVSIVNAFKNNSIFGGLKDICCLMSLYLKYKFGKKNLDLILKSLFVNDISPEIINNIIKNTTFKKKGFDQLIKLKKQKGIDVLNIVVLTRNSIDLVKDWINNNKVVLRNSGLQLVGVLGNKIVFLEDSKSTVILNPIIDTHTKPKIFPQTNNFGDKIIWMSDKDEQAQTKNNPSVESYFV